MSDEANSAIDEILHIRPELDRSAETDKVDGWLADASERVVSSPDVYRGLAFICRASTETLRAILVFVDGLGNTELEFFSIVSRMHRDLSVFVYGSSRAGGRLAEAIKRGATGEATESVIRAICNRDRSANAAKNDPIVSDESGAPSTSQPDSATFKYPDSQRPDETEGVAQANHHDEDSTIETRVPWQRYGRSPVRSAPVQRNQPTRQAPRSEAPKDRPAMTEPLLTDEELQALIGDPERPDDEGLPS